MQNARLAPVARSPDFNFPGRCGERVFALEMREGTMTVGPSSMAWGTWEELILGGAVLRHGCHDWNVVASELRSRTPYPYRFTPEVCESKYEELQKRYSGCTTWFEELRKKRLAELKRELERSEDSIGSLESKLKRLKAERGNCHRIDNVSSRTESPLLVPKTEGIELENSGKCISKDELSAGSFTQDTQRNWLSNSQVTVKKLPSPESPQVTVKKLSEVSYACGAEKDASLEKLGDASKEPMRTVRKRGERKRGGCHWEAKEGSMGESDNIGSTNFVTWNEASTSGCTETVRSSSLDVLEGDLGVGGVENLVKIFDSVAENGNATIFRRRLDSQKRARYRKIVRRHLDFDTIRSKITDYTIKSPAELLRDLLLLVNNALVFYSRRTREYKSALSLRDIVLRKCRVCFKGIGRRGGSWSVTCFSTMCHPPGKPRSFRSRPHKPFLSDKLPNRTAPRGYLKLFNSSSRNPPLLSTAVTNLQGCGNFSYDSGSFPLSVPKAYAKPTDANSGGVRTQQQKKKADPAPEIGSGELANGESDYHLRHSTMAKKGVGYRKIVGGERRNRGTRNPVVIKGRRRGRED